MGFYLWKKSTLLFILILIISCGSGKKPGINIFFEPELSIGVEDGDEAYMFGGIAAIQEDDRGNIYVLDFKFRTIKKFDKEGRFIKNIGEKGAGPGEFPQFTVDMVVRDEKIYVLLINIVVVFDTEGNYLKSFKLGMFPRYIFVDEKEKIILVESDRITQKMFHVFDSSGKHLTSYGEIFPAPDLKSQVRFSGWLPSSVWLSNDGRLFVGHPFQYEIFIYRDMEVVDTIRKKSEHYEESQLVEEKGGGVSRVGGLGRIFEAGDYLLVFLNSEKKGRYIEAFDLKHQAYKGSSKVEIEGYPHPVPDGRIYFGEDWRITRYRIVIE